MKLQMILPLLLLVAFMPAIKCATCSLFTDTNGKCVTKCRFPQIGNTNTKTCLANDSGCKTFYSKQDNVCLDKCPQYFAGQAVSGKSYLLCVPCLFKDLQGNCFQKCPAGLISDYTTYTCLNQSSQCSAFFVKDKQSCVKACPLNYIANTSQTPNICVNCLISGTCSNTNNNGSSSGITSNISCSQYLSANMKECTPSCPPGQIALAQVQGQSYQQCQLCPSSQPYISYDGLNCVSQCDIGEIINLETFNCIQPSQCTTFVYTDSNKNSLCVNQCPTNLQQVVASNTSSYGLCLACPSGQYLNLSIQQCVSTCQFLDATGKFCLSSISQCIGYISVDQTKCQTSCSSGLYIQKGNINGQFYCLAGCSNTQYIFQQTVNNITQNFCVNSCPQNFYPGTKNMCTSITNCMNYLSLDGKTCLTQCPSGQIPTTVFNLKIQQCKPCFQKISADSKSCISTCDSGQIYDMQSNKCQISTSCTGIQSNGLCLAQCQPGQLLYVDSGNNKSCINLSDCNSYISIDKKQCLSSCPTGQGITIYSNQKFCIFCKYGVASDGINCQASCPLGQIYSVAAKACTNSNNCSGMISANGKRCVASCEYPEVKPSSTATKCAYQCQSGQLYFDGVGCIAANSCTGYQSANGAFCVTNCTALNQIVTNSTSTPKICSKCPFGQYPQIFNSTQIQCAYKNTDISQNLANQALSIQSMLAGKTNLTTSQKAAIKGQFADMVSDLEQSIDLAQINLTLNSIDIQSNLQLLKSQIIDYLNLTSSYDNSTNSEQNQDQVNDENQVILGSSTIQVISEKVKKGFSFKLQFNLADLVSNSFISLQQDNQLVQLTSNSSPNTNTTASTNTTNTTANTNTTVNTNTTINTNSSSNSTNLINSYYSNLGIGNYNGQSDFSIQTMHFIYLSVNPYCQGSNCISGQAIIDTTGVSGKFRNLQSSSGSTYQLIYNVNAQQIKQTICVSYDSNGLMTINPTSINTSTNQITCTFVSNSSLYYDSTCQYVSSSLCSSSSSSSTPSQPSGNSSNSTSGFQATIYTTSLNILSSCIILAFLIYLII